jgi:hypothetical protein
MGLVQATAPATPALEEDHSAALVQNRASITGEQSVHEAVGDMFEAISRLLHNR